MTGLMGLDGLIILVVMVVIYGMPIVGLILLVRFLARHKKTASPERQLQKLDEMRGAGSITEAEYLDHRRRVLSEI